jgi:hypothetical protein
MNGSKWAKANLEVHSPVGSQEKCELKYGDSCEGEERDSL